MQSYISAIAYSVIPHIVYVFQLLVWPQANILAAEAFYFKEQSYHSNDLLSKKTRTGVILTVNATHNRKRNSFSRLLIHLHRGAITCKYSIYSQRIEKEMTKSMLEQKRSRNSRTILKLFLVLKMCGLLHIGSVLIIRLNWISSIKWQCDFLEQLTSRFSIESTIQVTRKLSESLGFLSFIAVT